MSELIKKLDRKFATMLDFPDPQFGKHVILAEAAVKLVSEWLAETEDRECNPLGALHNELKSHE